MTDVTVLIRGIGEIGSAVAWYLRRAGIACALQEDGLPATIRRRMAFSDAVFDGDAILEGVRAVRVDGAGAGRAVATNGDIPLFHRPLADALDMVRCEVLVDARMHKRKGPDRQIGLAPLVIGLGPGCNVGGNVDVAVETSWERLGAIVREGTTLPLRGEPRAVQGFARERFSYAPSAGMLRTERTIGETLAVDEEIAWVGDIPIRAIFSGVIRGLTRNGVRVEKGTKVAEVDPRPSPRLHGIDERPRRVAEAVVEIVRGWRPAITPLSYGDEIVS